MEYAAKISHVNYGKRESGNFERLLCRYGYVYMDSVPEGFDHVAFLRQFGPILPQYDGKLIWSIKADAHYENTYHSLNTRELKPHTECTEFDGLPPRYLALWCLVPASDGGGQTMLADLYAFLDTLTRSERAALASRKYEFSSTPGLQNMRLGRIAFHPVLEEHDDLPNITRFSYACMAPGGDPFILDIRERFLEFFNQTKAVIKFTANSLLLWDNFRMAHSRAAFKDSRRHLRRVWLGEGCCGCRKPMPPGDTRESRLQHGHVTGSGNGPGR